MAVAEAPHPQRNRGENEMNSRAMGPDVLLSSTGLSPFVSDRPAAETSGGIQEMEPSGVNSLPQLLR